MTQQQIDFIQMEKFLRAKLPVVLDQKTYLEYGDHNEISGSILSYLRIKYMNTAGGLQYRLCTLYLGTEGSGFYSPDPDVIIAEAMKQVIHYHRPTPMRKELQALMEKRRIEAAKKNGQMQLIDGEPYRLNWFVVNPGDPVKPAILACHLRDNPPKFFQNATVVDLTALD